MRLADGVFCSNQRGTARREGWFGAGEEAVSLDEGGLRVAGGLLRAVGNAEAEARPSKGNLATDQVPRKNGMKGAKRDDENEAIVNS